MVKYGGSGKFKPYLVDPDQQWTILEALSGIILRWNIGPIVEIGSSYGDSMYHRRKSTNIFAEKAVMAGVMFYTCDIFRPVEIDYIKHQHFAGSSFDFMKEFDDRPSIVFLDGCHDHETTIKEFYFFYDKLKKNGVIFLHDTCPAREAMLVEGSCCDSYKTRQEIEKNRNELDCDILTWPSIYANKGAGLTMVLKKDKDRPFFQR